MSAASIDPADLERWHDDVAAGADNDTRASSMPPHNLDAERSLIGDAIAAPEHWGELAELRPEHFYSEAHRRTFEAIAELHAEGQPITLVTLADRLRASGRLAQVGGTSAMAELVGTTAILAPAQRRAHVAIVVDHARARRTIELAARLDALARGGGGQAAVDATLAELAAVSGAHVDAGLLPTAAEPLRGLNRLAKVAAIGGATLRELAAQPVAYVWAPIAVAGTIILLASGPSEGKTTLLFLILAARANTGAPARVLGFEIQPAPPGTWIVLIEGEHSESSAARKLLRSLALLGIDGAALDRVILVARKAVRLGSPEWNDVVRLIAAGLVSDVAIDTVARVAPSDGDSEREQTAIFDQVAQAIDAAPSDATKPTCWACAHTRKNGKTGDVADVSGSTQRTGQADTVLMLAGEKVDGRTVSTRVVFAKLREEPEEYPAPVTFAIAGDEVRLVGAGDADGRPLEARILDQLQTGPKTKTALAAALRRSRADVDGAIGALFVGHRITTTSVTMRGRQHKAFELRNETGRTPEERFDRTTPNEDRTES